MDNNRGAVVFGYGNEWIWWIIIILIIILIFCPGIFGPGYGCKD